MLLRVDKIIIFFLQDMFYKTFVIKKAVRVCLFAFELFYYEFKFLKYYFAALR